MSMFPVPTARQVIAEAREYTTPRGAVLQWGSHKFVVTEAMAVYGTNLPPILDIMWEWARSVVVNEKARADRMLHRLGNWR